METPIDAYEYTIKKVNILKKSGIDVIITPCKSRTDLECVKKYNGPDRIPPDKWVNISFQISDKAQAIKIHKVANYLGMCGIRFDTGGCSSCRNWELDWSFSYQKGKEHWDLIDAREEVEDMINEMDMGLNFISDCGITEIDENIDINDDENIEM
jgi:hypothetical protein